MLVYCLMKILVIDDGRDIEIAFRLGVDNYISKPIDAIRICEIIADQLRRPSKRV